MRYILFSLVLVNPTYLVAEGFAFYVCQLDLARESRPTVLAFHDDGEGNVRDLARLSASVTRFEEDGFISVQGGIVIRLKAPEVSVLYADGSVTGTCSDFTSQVQELLMRARSVDVEGSSLVERELQMALTQEQALTLEQRRQVALLNAHVSYLQHEIETLQTLLTLAEEADAEAQVQIQQLSSQINTALARALEAERRIGDLERAERERLEAEAAAAATE